MLWNVYRVDTDIFMNLSIIPVVEDMTAWH